MTDMNKILFNIMLNIWSNQAYVQVFDCDSITSQKLLICFNAWILMSLFTKL